MADVALINRIFIDILVNHIFVRLPVRFLLRCRCVCKQWHELLRDPEFIRMHFKHQKIHHKKILLGPILYNKIPECGGASKEYRSKVEAVSGVFFSIDLESDAVRFPGFQPKDYGHLRTLGYCNGMFCAEVLKKNFVNEDYWKSTHLLFGNPSTGDYKILPDPIIGHLLVGFGYDSSVDDYKFVRVDNITRNPHIFSLKSNSWTTVLGSSDNYSIQGSIHNVGLALDGSIYWLAESSYVIVGFDLKDEEFRELPLPPHTRKGTLSMKVVGGSLCIINVCLNNEADIWLMSKAEENNHINNKEKYCWIKSMTVTLSATDFGIFFRIYPLCYMKDGKVLCCVEHDMDDDSYPGTIKHLLIDPITKRLEDFTIHGISSDWLKDYTFDAHQTAYIDSLVSPNYSG